MMSWFAAANIIGSKVNRGRREVSVWILPQVLLPMDRSLKPTCFDLFFLDTTICSESAMLKRLQFGLAVFGLAGFTLGNAAVMETRTSAGLALSDTPGQFVNITNITVPPGDWVATAKASIVNWGSQDYDRCVLMINGTIADGSTTMTGQASGFPAIATVVTQARVSSTASSSVALACSHDGNVAGQKVDPGASLVVSSSSGSGSQGPAGPIGPQGPTGPTGPKGATGPAVKTVGMCADATNSNNPQPGFCTCQSPWKVVSTTTSAHCTAAAESNTCSASGFTTNNSTFAGACCICGL